MENNDFLILDKNCNDTILIDQNSSKKISLFDNSKLGEINLKFDIESNANIEINILSIAKNNKKINVIFNHLHNNANSLCDVKIIGQKTANVYVEIKSIIPKETSGKTKQLINGLLTSDLASITTLPILKIDSEYVKAEHSVNIGSINKEFLFYLQSKNINYEEATKLILNNFFYKFINDSTKKQLDKIITSLVKEMR